MTEIFFDDEAVVFEGEAPRTVGELVTLCQENAGARQRVVSEILCDGSPCEGVEAARELASVGRVAVRTVSIREALRAVTAQSASSLEAAKRELAGLDREVLRSPWTVVRDRCIDLAGNLGATLEQGAALAGRAEIEGLQGELDGVMTRAADALEAWIEQIAAGEAAGVCLQGETKLAPRLMEFTDVLARVAQKLA
ncbi:MAG: hypothetical protein ACREIA_09790 [Opitutaceae bacterium]